MPPTFLLFDFYRLSDAYERCQLLVNGLFCHFMIFQHFIYDVNEFIGFFGVCRMRFVCFLVESLYLQLKFLLED